MYLKCVYYFQCFHSGMYVLWVCVCVFGVQTNSTTWSNSIMCFICVSVCVCVWGLFRYLTQLPPSQPHRRGYFEYKGWMGVFQRECLHCFQYFHNFLFFHSMKVRGSFGRTHLLFSQFLLIFRGGAAIFE